MELSAHTGKRIGSRRKRNDSQTRQAVFLTPTNLFGDDLEEEEPHDNFTVPQKASYVTKWKYEQNAVYWIRLSKAQDQGLKFWQTKSFTIMTYATIPGDCIDRLTSQNGERVDLERLETPRPVLAVTLKKNWQSQQQQHSTSGTDVPSLCMGQKGRTRLEHKTLRTIPQKRTSPTGNWGIPLRTWMWIFISAIRKSTRMHSKKAKL